MKKTTTLLLIAAALYWVPANSQVSTNCPTEADSLEGFQLDLELKHTGEAHDAFEAENQIRLAKRNYIDKKYQLGIYSPELEAARLNGGTPVTPQVACSNVNFETGDFSSWVGYIGDNQTSNAGPLNNLTPGFFSAGNDAAITNSAARHTIITSAFGNDPYGGFPGVPPGSGNYTVRMGGQTPNYQGEVMEQTFTVSPSSTSFAYRYAVVLNDPQTGHGQTDKPYFKIEVLDQNGQPISPCTQYFVIADATTLAGFTLSPLAPPTGLAYYKPWTTVNFDLSGYVNQNITVRFTVAGCTQSGHFGYCYFDCTCSSFEASINFCPGNTFLYLGAPDGYGTYQWFDQNHNPIPGATNDTLFVNNPVVGDTFFVYLVSGVDTSCHNLLPIVLAYTDIIPNATATDPTCYGYNDGSASATGTVGYPPYTYDWLTAPPQSTQTITGLSPGDYVIHLTDSLGCEAWDTVTVVETPRQDTSVVQYLYCPGNPNVVFYAPPGYTSYAWTDPNGNPIPGGTPTANSVTITNPVVGSEYNCVLTPPPGCPLYDSIIIPVLQYNVIAPTSAATGVSCYGYSDGTANSSGANGISPYSYSWNTNPAQTTAAISNLPWGTYIVHITDSMGCFIDDTVTVTSPERLDTSLFTYEYCFGDPRMTMYAPPGYTSYTWIGPGPDTLAVNTPDNYILLTNPQLGQEYVCIFVSPPACPIYDSTLLTFRPPAYYFHPDSTINIFTPNGDMKNDIFYPYFDHSVYVQTPQNAQPPYDFFDLHISYFEIWVYDRWGKEVFYSNDYTIGWDGSIDKGKNCSDGVYYWVSKMISNCSADQTPVVNEGFVHLIR